jgi:hypothetical protein
VVEGWRWGKLFSLCIGWIFTLIVSPAIDYYMVAIGIVFL